MKEVLWDAEEALGLARANRWDVLPGPNEEPRGGWDYEALAQANALEGARAHALAERTAGVPDGWHLDRGDEESDDEFDVREEAWRSPVIKQQWAETCVVKLRKIDPNTLFGRGKSQELALYIARNPECTCVFVNTTLTPTQHQNLQTVFANAKNAAEVKTRRDASRAPRPNRVSTIEVLDRTGLVLEIFHKRAKTPLAKAQVSMARLAYMKTRLTLGSNARLRETLSILEEHVGPFHEVSGFKDDLELRFHYETKPFETEHALLRFAESRLKKMIDVDQRTRKLHQSGRQGVPTLGLVGYTNAGKTTLMNQITNAGLKERDLLFQTLDTTLRQVKLPSGARGIIADSIGFIQDLPHSLITAFQSTLTQLISCDVLIHVRDMSHPQHEQQKQIVLDTLQLAGLPINRQRGIIEVWNKIDLLDLSDLTVPPNAILICAADGTGVDVLVHVLDTVISTQLDRRRRFLTFSERSRKEALGFLHTYGSVDSGTIDMKGKWVTVEATLTDIDWQRWCAKYEERSNP